MENPMPGAITETDKAKFQFTFPECKNEDTTKTLLQKIKILGNNLQYLEQGRGDVLYRDHYGVKTGKGYLYSDKQSRTLKHELENLTAAIEEVVESDWHTDIEKQRILRAAFAAISNPNPTNINYLQSVANEVQGHGSIWARVGIALGMIVAVVCCLILIGMPFIEPLMDAWKNNGRHGLSAATEDVVNAIKKTGAQTRLANNSFFYNPRVGNSTPQEGAESVATGEPSAPVELC
jgi:hypothetical protein